ncbi:MAG: hypothetical protein ABWX96_21335 [Propionibacteriaceae bacterium]
MEFFDLYGQPMTLEDWAACFGDTKARTVARDEIGDRVVVTVWLGHDEDFYWVKRTEPLIYGTALFVKGAPHLIHEVRTPNREKAEEAHAFMLANVANLPADPTDGPDTDAELDSGDDSDDENLAEHGDRTRRRLNAIFGDRPEEEPT